MLSHQAAQLANTLPGSVVNTNYPAVSKHAIGFTAGGFNDDGWELSQFSLALLANFGASLHNAVSKEHDSSRTEHVSVKNRTPAQRCSSINHEAGGWGGSKLNNSPWGCMSTCPCRSNPAIAGDCQHIEAGPACPETKWQK